MPLLISELHSYISDCMIGRLRTHIYTFLNVNLRNGAPINTAPEAIKCAEMCSCSWAASIVANVPVVRLPVIQADPNMSRGFSREVAGLRNWFGNFVKFGYVLGTIVSMLTACALNSRLASYMIGCSACLSCRPLWQKGTRVFMQSPTTAASLSVTQSIQNTSNPGVQGLPL